MPTAYSKNRPNKSSRSQSKDDRHNRSDDRKAGGSRKRDRDQYKEEQLVNEEKQEPDSESFSKNEEESQQLKKRKVDDDDDNKSDEKDGAEEQENQVPEHLRLSNFRISSSTVKNLEARGIHSLFEIQAATFDAIFDGNDVLARARTGTGKTLAFALPVIEKLALDTEFNARRGRAPRVLVMCPTRDLAKQVCGDFESVSGNRLKALAVYGGVPYKEQTFVLRDGVDVIVGTPGRVLDHIKFGNLKLHNIRFIILDEADEMLDARGFEEDMFNVLDHIKEQKSEARDYQTLLFSATVPDSVMNTIKRFMKEDYKRIDLVGNSSNRTNQNIRHIAMPTSYLARADIIGDVVNVYGRSGLTVIFCATKADANELGTHAKLDAAVLHGDIAQQSREATMKAFREGKYKCIVCTDVMSRGLDIPQVDLVINCQPPLDTESYVHRSGRTGRAGRKGICVTFYKPQEESILKVITRKTGVKFEMMAAARPEDIIKAATEDAFKQIETVKPEVLPFFAESADKLIEKHGARDAVAAVLALVSGYQNGIPTRSLLSGMENQITLFFQISHEIQHPGYVKNIINREYPELTDCKGWRMTRDMKGVVFDAPANQVEVQEDGSVWLCGRPFKKQHNVTLSALKELPELAERNDRQGGNGYGRFGGGGGGYGRNGGGNGYGRNGGGYQSGRNGYGGGSGGYGRNNGGDRQRNGYRGNGGGRGNGRNY